MKKDDAYELLVKEYLSKCRDIGCDGCVAEYYCIKTICALTVIRKMIVRTNLKNISNKFNSFIKMNYSEILNSSFFMLVKKQQKQQIDLLK